MVKILHKFFKAFQNYQRVVLVLLFIGMFGVAGVAVLKASFADSTSIINGYKVDQTGQPSSTQAAIANVPVEYTCCTLSGNSSPQSANPYSFSNLPQGDHQVSIYKANVPTGWVPLFGLCWEDGSCPNPAPTAMSYEGYPQYRYTVVINTSGHTVAHLWFHFRQNPPVVSLSVSPSSVAYGGSTRVSWSSSNSPTTCSNDFGGGNGSSGSVTVSNLTNSRSFVETCSNSGGTGQDVKSVTVGAKPNPPPPTPPPSTTPPPTNGGSGSPNNSNKSPTLQGSSNNSQPATLAPDKTPPSVPVHFLAEADSAKPLIHLKWDASSDDKGVQGYQLERSTDQHSWVIIAQTANNNFYEDYELTFATHYYYRVKAVDTSNNTSDYAPADATTATFQSNVSKDSGGTIKSEDNQATAVFPAGAFDQDVYCGIITPNELAAQVKGLVLAAGPYKLLCQAQDGTLLTDFKQPATASITLDSRQRKNYTQISYYEKDGDNWKQATVKGDSLELNHASSFALYGKRKTTPIWVKIIIVLLVIIGLAGLVIGFLYLRYRRGLEAKADDYWRKSKGF